MKIGIDISQTAYEGTGVANYLTKLVEHLLAVDKKNEYVLFYSSARIPFQAENLSIADKKNIQIKTFKFPPTLLDFLWNKLHIFPIEWLIGNVDVFISSDWVQPPLKNAKGVTVLYDLIIYKYPEESHDQLRFNIKNMNLSANIVASQKRRLRWVKKECSKILCISQATKNDAREILKIEEEKLAVIYPGFSL